MNYSIRKSNHFLNILLLIGFVANLHAQISSYHFCSSGFVNSPWTCIGQNPTPADFQDIGIITAVAAHPDDPQTIYAGGDGSGLWKTIDEGANWVNKTDILGVSTLGITALAIHPNNPNMILAGTYTKTYDWRYYDIGMGILKSVDGGNTWQCTNIATFPVAHKNIKVIRFHPTDPNIVLAAGNKFIYKSTDAGSTWNTVYESPYLRVKASGSAFIDIEFLPSNPSIVLASTDFRGAPVVPSSAQLFLSTNTGSDWTNVTPSDAFVQGQYKATAIAIDVTPADPNHFYIMYENGLSNQLSKACIKKSSNGINWTQIAQFNRFASWGSWDKYEFEVSNNNLNTFYAGGISMHRSIDAGNTWSIVDNNIHTGGNPVHSTHVDIRSLIQFSSTSSEDCLIMGNDGGIAKTTDNGTTWWNLNGNGLIISEYYAVGTFNSNNNIVGGLQDNGTKLYDSNTNTWNHKYGGDGGWTEVDYSNDNIVYATCNASILKSNDGGKSYNSILSKGSDWSTWDRFHLDPTDHNKLWVPVNTTNTLKVYNATNSTWTDKYSFTTTTQNISAIHVAPSNGNIVYVAISGAWWTNVDTIPRENKLFKSTNGGNTFTDISANCTAYDWAFINDFCIDPNNPDRIWAGCAMYRGKDNPPSQGIERVIYSENGGSSWADISTGLPPFAVYYLKYRENSDDEIYAGTEGGVYRWDKQQSVWECFNNGFPPAFVTKLEINNCKNKIVASTFGRGIWEAPLPPLSQQSPLVISTPQTWDQHSYKVFTSDISISTGAILTIKGIVKLAENCKITIHPGAKLVLDGGTLINWCSDMLWQGIYVGGNANSLQYAYNQGVVELKNGAIIQGAKTAIATYILDANGNINYNSAGGIIQADSATFINNSIAVEYIPYPPIGSSLIRQNAGYFKNCSFIVNDHNLFAGNNTQFFHHIKLWGVSGLLIKQCEFKNEISSMPDRRQAIYTLEAGYVVNDYCSQFNHLLCSCTGISKPSVFDGFKTAIESTNLTKQYAIRMDRCKFRNNITGISLKGKDSFVILESDISLSNNYHSAPTGIYMHNCTNFQVDDNNIYSNMSGKGIYVTGTMADENKLYRNTIHHTSYGIYVGSDCKQQGQNYFTKGFPAAGLQFICNNLNNNTNDLYVCPTSPVRAVQGSNLKGADNRFSHNPNAIYNFYLEIPGLPIDYFYDNTDPIKKPDIKTSNIFLYPATANPCIKTDCPAIADDFWPETEMPNVKHTQSPHSALETYRELNHTFSKMMSHFYFQGYDIILTHYYNGIIENEELLKEAMTYHEAILAVTEEMAELSHNALFRLKTDTVIDLAQIRDWYDEIYTLNAKYSLAETCYQLGKFEEGFNTLALIPEKYNLNEEQMIEHNNYVALFTFKNSIRESGRTIAQLTEAEIKQLLSYAEASRGLSSTIAQGILCFFYNICIEEEEEGRKQKAESRDDEMIRGLEDEMMQTTAYHSPRTVLENITLVPNPTTGELRISPAGGGLRGGNNGELRIENVEVFDVYGRQQKAEGRKQKAEEIMEIDISLLPAGVYFVKITTDAGEVMKKVIKQ